MTHGPPRTRVRHTTNGASNALATTAHASVATQSFTGENLGTVMTAGLADTTVETCFMGTAAFN